MVTRRIERSNASGTMVKRKRWRRRREIVGGGREGSAHGGEGPQPGFREEILIGSASAAESRSSRRRSLSWPRAHALPVSRARSIRSEFRRREARAQIPPGLLELSRTRWGRWGKKVRKKSLGHWNFMLGALAKSLPLISDF